MKVLSSVLGFVAILGVGMLPANAIEIPKSRIDQIVAMSPAQMARTGAWTSAAYDRFMGYVYSIKDKELRDFVLDMLINPNSTVFNAKAQPDALRMAPAAGGPGHHYYPGGLAVHLLENIEIALGWVHSFDSVHGIRNTDRDLVIAELALHDWSKVWYEWDPASGKVKKPAWYPAAWGGKDGVAKWGWMGEHGAVLYSELLKRKAPEKLLFGAASAHFDPHWDIEVKAKDGTPEGFNPAMVEAAKIAGTGTAPKLDPAKRRIEWFLANYSDGSWSLSHYVAGQSAHKWIRAVAKDIGVDPESPAAAKLASFVLSRISDFKLYKEYQDADFSEAAVKEKIMAILADSSAYEVQAVN